MFSNKKSVKSYRPRVRVRGNSDSKEKKTELKKDNNKINKIILK